MEKTSKRSGDTFRKIMKNQYTVLVGIFVLVVIAFTILKADRYFSPSNLKNILNGAVIISLLAIAESLLILSGHIDLGAGQVGAFGGVAVAMFMRDGLPWPLALLIVLIFGAALGGVNAVLVNKFNFQSFISTLAVGSIAEGLAYILSNGIAIPVTNESFYFLGVGKIAGIPFAIILSLLIILIYGIILARTKFGRSIYLVGGNPVAAKLAGLHPKRVTSALFINAGALSALSGMILASRIKTGSASSVMGTEFKGITAAILGGIAFGGGSGTMLGCFIGIMIINSFNNGLTVMGVDSFWQKVAQGALLIVALLIDFYRHKANKRV